MSTIGLDVLHWDLALDYPVLDIFVVLRLAHAMLDPYGRGQLYDLHKPDR